MDIDKYKLRELVTEWSREERERERYCERGKDKERGREHEWRGIFSHSPHILIASSLSS